MPRTLSAAEIAILQLPTYGVLARTYAYGHSPIYADGLVDPLISFAIGYDVEQLVMTATVVLDLMGTLNLPDRQSLSPYLSTGLRVGGAGVLTGLPLLGEGMPIGIEIQCVDLAAGALEFGWRNIFEGVIDKAVVAPKDGTLTLQCKDKFSVLQKQEIENISPNAQGQPAWGFPVAAMDVYAALQYLVTTAATYVQTQTGLPYGQNGLLSPGDPLTPNDWMELVGTPPESIGAYWQQRTNLFDAMRAIAVGKDGWDLRGRWDSAARGPNTYTLTYFEPPRDTTTAPAEYFTQFTVLGDVLELSRDISEVRNVVEVTPADAARVPVVSSAPINTIVRQGRRFMGLSEDQASHIDTPAEAATLGAIGVADLSVPKASVTVGNFFPWWLQLHDIFVIGSDGYSFDALNPATGQPLQFCVTHIDLTWNKGDASGSITGRELGSAVLGSRDWRAATQDRKPKKIYLSPNPPVGPAAEGAQWFQITQAPTP